MARKEKKEDLVKEEIVQKIAEIDRELYNLRNELAVHRKIEKPHLLKAKRHEKARLLTALTQKERMA